ncbi:MAG: hypothetical protein OXU20_38590 [Myxococcales bacterium]|nr:hypothetical protein [Myxococcales bacterium]MDD9965581.1 hypothetical protein [Myxococcales bacterium]
MRQATRLWALLFLMAVVSVGCGSDDDPSVGEETLDQKSEKPSEDDDGAKDSERDSERDGDADNAENADEDRGGDSAGERDGDPSAEEAGSGASEDPSEVGDPDDPAGDGAGAEEPTAMIVPAIDDPDISSPSVVIPDAISHAADAEGNYPDLRGRCDINSGYPGDDACIPPPPEDEGFQIHVGPKDYDDEEEVAKFLMEPGDESSECWTYTTPNDKDIMYQTSVLSGRAGTHHIIHRMHDADLSEGSFTVCAGAMSSVGSLPGASRAYIRRSLVAPEDAHIGRAIPANIKAQADMHYFNLTEEPLIREFWLNIYYADEEVTDEADQIVGMGGFGWNSNPIPPGADMVYQYECPIVGDGRILQLLGHYHAQGKRFTAYIERAQGGDMEKVFEMYDYLEPAIFDYNSVTDNPKFTDSAAGAHTGMLEVQDGDTLHWECHIQNNLEVGLRYTNQVVGGEMCNIWGASYGIDPLRCYHR